MIFEIWKVSDNEERRDELKSHEQNESSDEDDDEEEECHETTILKCPQRHHVRQELHIMMPNSTTGSGTESNVSPNVIHSPHNEDNKEPQGGGLLQCTSPETAASVDHHFRG